MSDLDQLANLIITILGKDNEARRQSESFLHNLQIENFNQYILVFANLLSASPRKDIKTFCLLHLRRLLSDFADDDSESQWAHLTAETQKYIKDLLVQLLVNETELAPQKILCDFVGELVATIKGMSPEVRENCPEEGRQWESIMPNIWNFLTSGNLGLMASGLKILGILFKHCSEDFAEHKDQLVPIMKQALEHEDLKIKTRAIEALSEYLENADWKNCKVFIDLLPFVLADILIIIDKDEDLGVEVLAYLTDIVEIEAKIFKHYFAQTIETLKAIAQNDGIETSAIRENALETMIILIEKFPVLSGKQEGLVKQVYLAIFTYMITCVTDPDDEWFSPPEGYLQLKEENETSEFSVKYCMDLFNRLIARLGQLQTLPTLSSLLQEMVGSNDWRYKYSALMALSQVGEHIGDIAEMDPIVTFNLHFFTDENPKVRYAAFHCIGQLADDKRTDFQTRYSHKLMLSFIESFNEQTPRVLAHALAALTNFLEGCTKKEVEGFVLKILEPCLGFIDTGISLVKENAISTIAALAEAAREDFIPYWEKTAEVIFMVLRNVNQREYKQLRGQAIECLTLIGEAIGKEEFKKAAEEIIKMMISIQKDQMEEVDPQKAYLLAGWQRLSSTFKDEFSPYLKEIYPPLLTLIHKIVKNHEKRHMGNSNNEEDGEEGENEPKPNRMLLYAANTSETEEVIVAVRMISTFLVDSGEGCLPFIDKTSQLFAYLLTTTKNDNIRLTVVKALPGIISVLKKSTSPEKEMIIATTTNAFQNILWKLYSVEGETANLMIFLQSMKGLILEAGRCMDERQMKALNENIMSALTESDQRKRSNHEQLLEEGNDIDEDQYLAVEEDNEKEEDLHCVIAELICTLFQTHQEITLPFAQFISKSILTKALDPNGPPKIQKFGLLLIIGMIEHLGTNLIPNDVPLLSEILIRFIETPFAEVRDTAANGIGMLAEKSKDEFKTLADPCLKGILGALAVKAKKEENQKTFWRARVRVVVALGKIIKHQSHCINVNQFIQIWFRNLPLAYYVEDAKMQHEMLIDIIELNPTLIFGENGQNLPHTIKIFAQLVQTKLVSDTFEPKMKKVVEALATNEKTKPLLQEAIQKLDQDLQGKLQKVLMQG